MVKNAYPVLGTFIQPYNLAEIVKQVGVAVRTRQKMMICFVNVYAAMMFKNRPAILKVINTHGISVPDGMPIVWVGKLYGKSSSRVYGADVVRDLCTIAMAKKYRLYFLGGSKGQSSRLNKYLCNRYPGIVIVGMQEVYTRPLTSALQRRVRDEINALRADIVFVGLGTVHQEEWIIANRNAVSAPVIMGVGSAFDFLSGDKVEAPVWMQRAGLAWFHRFIQEPKRLWYRYTIVNVGFVWNIFIQLFRDALTRKIIFL